jgi:hypothetical protein
VLALLASPAHPQEQRKSHHPRNNHNDEDEMGLPCIRGHWYRFKRRVRTDVLLQGVHVRISTDYTTV